MIDRFAENSGAFEDAMGMNLSEQWHMVMSSFEVYSFQGR